MKNENWCQERILLKITHRNMTQKVKYDMWSHWHDNIFCRMKANGKFWNRMECSFQPCGWCTCGHVGPWGQLFHDNPCQPWSFVPNFNIFGSNPCEILHGQDAKTCRLAHRDFGHISKEVLIVQSLPTSQMTTDTWVASVPPDHAAVPRRKNGDNGQIYQWKLKWSFSLGLPCQLSDLRRPGRVVIFL